MNGKWAQHITNLTYPKIKEFIKKIIQWDKFVGIYMIEHSMFEGNRVFNLTYPKIKQVLRRNYS